MEVETSEKTTDEKFEFPSQPDIHFQTPLKSKASNRWKYVVGSVTAAGIVAGVAGFMMSKKPTPVEPKTKVPVLTITAEKATLRPMMRTIKVNGTVWPWDPLTIGSQVNGLSIQSIYTDDGQVVKKGQILARLDSSVLQAQLEQEKARLQSNEAALAKSIQPNRVEDIQSLKAAVAQADAQVSQERAGLLRAQANLSNAIENTKRYGELVKQGAVSKQDADNRTTDSRLAQADVSSAEQRVRAAQFAHSQASQRYSMAVQGGRKEDVQISRATVAASRATVRQLEAQIEQTIIRSPVDGLVMKRDAHLGDITSAGKSLFQIVRDNRLELRAQVAEVELMRVKPGMSVDITGNGKEQQNIKGIVREISPIIDQDTRLGTVRIDVPGSAGFKPGNFIRGEIKLGDAMVLTIPAEAVLTKSDESFALVLTPDNQVKSKIVKTGNRRGEMVEIRDGLTTDDTVAVKGSGFVKDGDYVRVGTQK